MKSTTVVEAAIVVMICVISYTNFKYTEQHVTHTSLSDEIINNGVLIADSDDIKPLHINTAGHMSNALASNDITNENDAFAQSITDTSSNNDVDDASLLYHIDVDGIRNRSVNGTLMHYLPDYKNPCWMENGPLYHNRKRMLCLPYVYVVGMAKCGTTAFYDQLTLLPDVAEPTLKEPNFWNRRRFRNNWKTEWDNYMTLYMLASRDIKGAVETQQGKLYHPKITVDASPEYIQELLDWKDIPGNKGLIEPKFILAHTLRRIFPDTKIIILLRNPTDRMFSHYHHISRETFDINRFAEAVPKKMTLFNDCLKNRSLRACVYDTQLYRKLGEDTRNMAMMGSIYFPFIKDWLAVFPRSQVLILRSEDYYKNTTGTMVSAAQFLGLGSLDHITRQKIARTHVGSTDYPTMPNHTRKALDDFFRPYNKLLADFLGNKDFLWMDDTVA